MDIESQLSHAWWLSKRRLVPANLRTGFVETMFNRRGSLMISTAAAAALQREVLEVSLAEFRELTKELG